MTGFGLTMISSKDGGCFATRVPVGYDQLMQVDI